MKVHAPKSLRTAIQVLVFQDGLASRNFEIPLAWISRLGWYIGGSLLVTILSVGTTIHFWRQSHRAQPERLRELEQQIRVLGEAKLKADAVVPGLPAPAPVAAASLGPTLTGVTPVVCAPPAVAPAPAPVPAAPCAPTIVTRPGPGTPATVAFRSFPVAIMGEVPLIARPSVPLEVSSPLTQWQGRKLKLQFDIRFTGKEGDNQQGRIVVLARGPDVVLGYPSGAVRGIDSPHLFDPEKGEFFSVSRFRQTKVEFPAVDSSIQTVEILLFGPTEDGAQKLLVREIVKVPPPRGGAREAAAPEEN
jgi:hypothetical protein